MRKERVKHKFWFDLQFSGGVAHSVRVPNSKHKIASSMPTLGITCCCVCRKTLNAIIPTSSGAAQWCKWLVIAKLAAHSSAPELRNVSLCPSELRNVSLCPSERHFTFILLTGPSNLSIVLAQSD